MKCLGMTRKVEYSRVMGMSILAFACSIEAFRKVYGCRDQALYEKMIQSDDYSTRHYLGLNYSDPKPGEEQKAALREIIAGVALEQFDASTYGYSSIAVLYAIGEYLGSNGGSYGRQMDADGVLSRMGEKLSALPQFDVRWPIGNICVSDWPMIQTIPLVEVKQYAEIMTDIMTRVTEKEMGDETPSAYQFLVDLCEYYRSCTEKNQDLILVAH